MIAALDTDGKIWCALTQANTDSDVLLLFLRSLARQLDLETPGWELSSTILLDNAPYHVSPVMKRRLANLGLPIMYSGPYCYGSVSILCLAFFD